MAVRLPVDPNENLDQIIARLKKHNSQDVVLVLPPETRVLQELNNFYTLRSAVRAENINLSIAGGNKTIRGLANLLGFSIEKEGAVTSFKPDAPAPSTTQPTANSATVFRPNYSGLPDGMVTATPPPPQPVPIRPAQPQNFVIPPAGDNTAGRLPLPRPGFNLGVGDETPGSNASTYDEVSRNGFFNNNNLGKVDATFQPADKSGLPLDEPIIDFDKEELPDTVAGQFRGRKQAPVLPTFGGRPAYPNQEEYSIEEVADPDAPNSEVVAAKGRTRRIAAGPVIKTTTRTTVTKVQTQDNRQRLILIFGVLFALLLLVLLAMLLIKPGGGGVLNLGPSVQTLTVPLKTEAQTATVRLALVEGTIGAAAPTATTASGTVGTSLPGTPGAAATTVPVGPANLPVEMVNTGQIRKSGEHAATGSRKVPDKPASGPAIFYNRSFSPKSYGAGAVIYTRNGVTYRLVRAITIESSQTLNGQAGQATGEVVADKAGTIGNISEVVSFPLNENVGIGLGPLTNGSDKDEKFITQADQDDLKKQLRDQATAEVNNALKYDQTTQGVLVIKTSEPVCEFPKKINEIADSFAGSCTTSLEAARYNSNDVSRIAAAHMVTDPAYRLDPNSSIEFTGAPKLVEDGGTRYMEVQVKGTVISTLDVEAFKAAIAGKTKAAASILIASDFPQVDLSLLDMKSLTGDSIPTANLLEIKTVLDYEAAAQATQTVTPNDTNGASPTATIKS